MGSRTPPRSIPGPSSAAPSLRSMKHSLSRHQHGERDVVHRVLLRAHSNRCFYLSNRQGQSCNFSNTYFYTQWGDVFVIGQQGYQAITVTGGYFGNAGRPGVISAGVKRWLVKTVNKTTASALMDTIPCCTGQCSPNAGFEDATADTSLGYSHNPVASSPGSCSSSRKRHRDGAFQVYNSRRRTVHPCDSRGVPLPEATQVSVTCPQRIVVAERERTSRCPDAPSSSPAAWTMTAWGSGAPGARRERTFQYQGSNGQIVFRECNFPYDTWEPTGRMRSEQGRTVVLVC